MEEPLFHVSLLCLLQTVEFSVSTDSTHLNQARQLGALSRGHRADEGLLRARLYADIRSPDGRGWRAGQHSSSPDSGHPTPGGQGGGLKQFWSRDTDSSRSAASSGSVTGGIFNLEYNADGSILAAACEQKSFLLFDPGSRRLVKTVEAAHRDCVNCVRSVSHSLPIIKKVNYSKQ